MTRKVDSIGFSFKIFFSKTITRLLFSSKVHIIQTSSEIFFELFYIPFDRGHRAAHEYVFLDFT